MKWEEIVGRNVRRLRLAKDWSQEDLAGAVELDVRSIGGIERGTQNTTVAVLGKIAIALGGHPRDLFDD